MDCRGVACRWVAAHGVAAWGVAAPGVSLVTEQPVLRVCPPVFLWVNEERQRAALACLSAWARSVLPVVGAALCWLV